MDNKPDFDPLNPTPAEEADMFEGYLDGWRRLPLNRESLAYAWGRGSAARDRGDEPDEQRREIERRMREMFRVNRGVIK